MKLKILLFLLAISMHVSAQYSHADSLRGSYGKYRANWDVQHYNLNLHIDIDKKYFVGKNTITFKNLQPDNQTFQIDLQAPLKIDSAFHNKQMCTWEKDGNAYFIKTKTVSTNTIDSIIVYYSGIPTEALFPPWQGGIIWRTDEKNNPWLGVACQGDGASLWWPTKEHQSDEPDNGMQIAITIPDSLINISNGKLTAEIKNNNGTKTFVYNVKNPINNYCATFNIGKYKTVKDTFNGKNGVLPIEYAVLDYTTDEQIQHLQKNTKQMLASFEYWFGPYPFYDDGFRLVHTPYLGMEHQSGIAYGNKFKNGYLGTDRSGTGYGRKWDYIVIHESGHEWFGNNITAKDIADMWIQEAFTTYSEVLFIESTQGKEAANKYVQGLRKNIQNLKNIIGDYNVNNEGNGDMYDKGANMIHTIRQIINNDSLFRAILIGLNKEFGKKTVTTEEIENYIIDKSSKPLKPIFNQYLRTTEIPTLTLKLKRKKKLIYQ